jgi:hypothetical protein
MKALFDTLASRIEGVLFIYPDGRSASAFVVLSRRKFYNTVLQKSVPTQNRQLILYISSNEG